jgi:hypothetical protein
MEALLRKAQEKGYSREAAEMLQLKVVRSTHQTYNSSWKVWSKWCEEHQVNEQQPTQVEVVNFMGHLWNKGADYGRINAVRSALVSVVPSISEMGDVYDCVKGAAKARPPQTRYDDDMWNPQDVIDVWKADKVNNELSVERLRSKAISLHTLASHNRPSDTARMAASTLRFDERRMQYKQQPSKTWKRQQGQLQRRDPIDRFSDSHVCPVAAVQAYLERTREIRGIEEGLWLHLKRSKDSTGDMVHQALGADRVSKVLLEVLQEANIDIALYKGGSYRSASSSKALENGATVDAVMKRGNWASMSVFNRFYNRAQKQHGVTTSVWT